MHVCSYKSEADQQQRLLLLIEKFSEQYQKRYQSFEMIVDLLQLDTPCLLMFSETDSPALQHISQQFRNFLKKFICGLQNQLVGCAEILLVSSADMCAKISVNSVVCRKTPHPLTTNFM